MMTFSERLLSRLNALDKQGEAYTVKCLLKSGLSVEMAVSDYSSEYLAGDNKPTDNKIVIRLGEVVYAEILP
jgi:hypothetical protein